jgi:tellurite resistance protein TehA-like permease
VGASLSVVLTVVFLYFWNSQEIARVQGGNIAIWLGPNGCALVGAVFVIACLASARRRLTPRPAQHCWKVRGTNK